jgi:hypothetical protein
MPHAGGASSNCELVSGAKLDYLTVMTAVAALAEQIKRYRGMTGEQRLAVALELHEMSCEIAREGIHRQNPRAGAAEIERLRIASELERLLSGKIKPKQT